jgi:hypothetical protein
LTTPAGAPESPELVPAPESPELLVVPPEVVPLDAVPLVPLDVPDAVLPDAVPPDAVPLDAVPPPVPPDDVAVAEEPELVAVLPASVSADELDPLPPHPPTCIAPATARVTHGHCATSRVRIDLLMRVLPSPRSPAPPTIPPFVVPGSESGSPL